MNKAKFMYAPDDATGGKGTGDDKTNKTAALPQSDVDFMDVSKDVSKTWLATPAITLVWKTAGDFSNEVRDYAASLINRQNTGSKRPSLTLTLKQLDKKIDAAVAEVKVYILKKFKKEGATAQFPRYGIVKENTAYVMSRDRNNRNNSFSLMLQALLEDGFDKEEFGTAFWTGVRDEYSAALELASNTTGEISGKVATKNQQKQAITSVMKSLMLVLKGNYPGTWKQVYREWGWKKESF